MQVNLQALGNIIIITGHYGCGKTNIAVNMAVNMADAGVKIALCDLDIVNPYFRSSDFAPLAATHGIEICAPVFAGSNLDTPALDSRLDALLGQHDKTVIIDVGGDAQGAIALGRYANTLKNRSYTMLYVINQRRPNVGTATDAVGILQEIEHVSRITATYIVNNTHLCGETTAEVILQSAQYANAVSKITGKDIAFTAVPKALAQQTIAMAPLLPVEIYVKAPW